MVRQKERQGRPVPLKQTWGSFSYFICGISVFSLPNKTNNSIMCFRIFRNKGV
ncbi:unnamed protein product [Rhodiola kirilowii]